MADSRNEAFEQLLRRVAETPAFVGIRQSIRPGRRLAGRFEVERKLGAGGMGQVFSVFDHAQQNRVAAKVLGRLTPDAISRMKAEFRSAAEIVHPNLVRLHELFSDEDEWFFTMDLVKGVTLPALLRSAPGAATNIDLIRAVFRQLALALETLHRAHTLHRDLKPPNFLICEPDHRVVLLDFGLAQAPDPNRPTDLSGTPFYMAPEQALGEALSESADWYAFGVVLFEALTGELPFGRPSPGLLDGETRLQPVNQDVGPFDKQCTVALSDSPPDLAQLCLRLLQPRPSDRPKGHEVLRVLGVSAIDNAAHFSVETAALVGRESELAVLEEAFGKTRAGQTSMVFIPGPSGIGKTALVEHFARSARARGALVLKGRCRERESMGYKAVDGLIDSVVEFLNGLPDHEALSLLPPDIADLIILFPSLGAAVPVARIPKRDTETRDRAVLRRQAIAAFGNLLASFQRRAPLIVWIDDLQWSDAESALLLGPLLDATSPTPLLFLGTYRGDADRRGPLLNALTTDRALKLPVLHELHLGPLPIEHAEHLALQLLSTGDRAALAAARKIGREAGGHPLFITELAYSARGAGRKDGAPASLFDLVTKRVAMLPAAGRAFLEATAVAGVPVARAVLRNTLQLSPADAEGIVELLRANRLVTSLGLMEHDAVDLPHDRIREIVVQGLTEPQRRGLHLHLAKAFAIQPGTHADVMATHYQAAGELATAGRFWILAADQALRALAFGHAADLYGKGLGQAALTDETARPSQIRRAEALSYAGRSADAADVFLTTAASCDPDQALDLRRRAAEQLLLSGHLERGLGVIEDVLQAIGMPGTRGGRKALLSTAIGRIHLKARGLRHLVRSETDLSREEIARLDASWTIACSLGAVDFIRGAHFQTKHLLLALRAGEPRRLLRALTLEVSYAATPGPGSEARTTNLLAVADLLAQRIDDESATSLLCLNRGIAAYLQGRLYDSLNSCEDAIRLLGQRSVGAVWEMVTAQRFAVASLFFLGQLRRLTAFVPPLLAEAERNGNLYATMCFRSGYGTVSWLQQDAVAEAREQIDRARSEWKAPGFQLSHYNFLIGETFLDLYTGDGERAFARLQEQWPLVIAAQLHRISVIRVQLRQLRASSALLVANISEARGQHAKAAQLRQKARIAARSLRSDPLRRAAPFADIIESVLDHRSGDRRRGQQRLKRAIQAFDEQDMKLFAAAARVRMGEISDDREGDAMAVAGRNELRDQGVANSARMVDLLAPGFAGPDHAPG